MTRHTLARHLGAAMGATLVASLVALVLVAQTPQPEALLGAALHLEEVEGDLEAAIAEYERVIAHAAVDRATAGRAWLRIGVCYEKLGRPEASAAYERVISEFADRPEAAEALFRVRALGAAGAVSMPGQNLVARQILQSYQVGGPSPDGRFFSVTDWETGNLAVRDLETNDLRFLTDAGYPQVAYESVFSSDGSAIAYSWYNEQGLNELRIVNRDGSGDRLVFADPRVAMAPEDWSPDGQSILVRAADEQGWSIAMVSVPDKQLRKLNAGGWRPDLSPDGRYVTYDAVSNRQSPDVHDIFVVATDGGQAVPLVSSPANDRSAIWTPDGGAVLFLSNRGGGYDLWVQEVDGGVARGAPRLARAGLGDVELLGLTRAGDLYYSIFSEHFDIQLARYDDASGTLTALPVDELTTRSGLNRFPWWSPEGDQIAYVHREPGSARQEHSLVVRTLSTGEEREFDLGRWYLARVKGWSADGRRILLTGYGDGDIARGIYWLDARSGDVELIARARDSGGTFAGARLSPRGDTVFFARYGGIVARDVATGEQRSIGPPDGAGARWAAFAVSPDGRQLAFQSGAGDGLRGAVMVMNADGSEAREVYPPGRVLHGLTWTPDGRYLLALIAAETDDAPGSRFLEASYAVWRIPADGGAARPTGLTVGVNNKLSGLTFHPDGRTFTYVDGESVGEVWVLENLMADVSGR